MRIITLGHNDRYSVEQISCLFFEKDAEVEIISEYNDAKKTIETCVKYKNKQYEVTYTAGYDDIREFKNSVKKSAYLAMKKISGNNVPWGILTGIRPTKFCRELHNSLSYDEIRNILISEYWVNENKADFCIEVTENSEKLIKNIKSNEIGLYIGVPFCPSRCSYCSFISESAALYSKYIPEYSEALIKEIKSIADVAKDLGLRVSSLYIGGGTPPTLGIKNLSSVIETTLESFSICQDAEFTVEAGRPDVITEELLAMLKSEGVNRLCINPQTLNDDTLKLIGRNHNSSQTERAFELARKHSFNNINSDIIAGLPGENIDCFLNTLEKIKTLSPEGLTVHTMYLKRTSRITKEKEWHNCGKDVDKMLDSSLAFAKRNSYKPYYMYKQRSTLGNLENTGYAKEGFESLYNSAIMEEVQTVFACGAGASTKIVTDNDIQRVYNIKDAFSYIRDIDAINVSKSEKLKKLIKTN